MFGVTNSTFDGHLQSVFRKSAGAIFKVSENQVIINQIRDDSTQLRGRASLKGNQILLDYTMTFYGASNAPNLTIALAAINSADFSSIFRSLLLNDTLGYAPDYVAFLNGISLGPGTVYLIAPYPSSAPTYLSLPLAQSSASDTLIMNLSISLAVMATAFLCLLGWVLYARNPRARISNLDYLSSGESELDKPIDLQVVRSPNSVKGANNNAYIIEEGGPSRKESPRIYSDAQLVPLFERPMQYSCHSDDSDNNDAFIAPSNNKPAEAVAPLHSKFYPKNVVEFRLMQQQSFMATDEDLLKDDLKILKEDTAVEVITANLNPAWDEVDVKVPELETERAKLLSGMERSSIKDFAPVRVNSAVVDEKVLPKVDEEEREEAEAREEELPPSIPIRASINTLLDLEDKNCIEEESIPEAPFQVSSPTAGLTSYIQEEEVPVPKMSAWDLDEVSNKDSNETVLSNPVKSSYSPKLASKIKMKKKDEGGSGVASPRGPTSQKQAEVCNWSIGDVVTVVGQKK